MSRQEVRGQRSRWAAPVTAELGSRLCRLPRPGHNGHRAGLGRGLQQCVSGGFYNHVQDLPGNTLHSSSRRCQRQIPGLFVVFHGKCSICCTISTLTLAIRGYLIKCLAYATCKFWCGDMKNVKHSYKVNFE